MGGRKKGEPPPHGTSNRYKNHQCRCVQCAEAGRKWMREYYRRTNGLTKMVRSGEPMKKGSQGGPNARGHRVLKRTGKTASETDALLRASQSDSGVSGGTGLPKDGSRGSEGISGARKGHRGKKRKPKVIDYEPGD